MTESPSVYSTPSEVSFLVCESGRRWCDAARRFLGPFQHAPRSRTAGGPTRSPTRPGEPLFVVQSVEHSRVRSMIAGRESVAVLWEISPGDSTSAELSSLALSIAKIGVGRPDVFQMIAVGDGPGADADSLTLRVMELGVAAIVQSPEQLATMARLIRRRFSSPVVACIESI